MSLQDEVSEQHCREAREMSCSPRELWTLLTMMSSVRADHLPTSIAVRQRDFLQLEHHCRHRSWASRSLEVQMGCSVDPSLESVGEI